MAWTCKLAVLIVMILARVAQSQDYLQYIDLGTTAGVSHTQLPIADNVNSDPILIPYGFAFGTSIATLAYVNTNGYIVFDDDLNVYMPVPFPASTDLSLFVAPFWADIDIQSSGTGSVSYEIHTGSTSPELLSQVGGVIRQQNPGSDFAGTWMLVAEWRDVPEKSSPTNLLNTFQALVITNGYRSYSVFTYNCTGVNWGGPGTSVVGFKADESYYVNHPMSNSQSVSDIDCSNPASTFVNVIYQLNQDSIREFISLGTTESVTQVTLPSEIDSASQAISIPGGYPFGTSRQSTVRVVEHGYFSFGSQSIDSTPGLFPGSASYLVAPFWASHDARGGGQVSYEVHSASSDALSLVSTFVSQQMQTDFFGTWMLVAMWDGVHQFPYTNNTDVTNTYQAILVTDGGVKSYAVFIYSCSLMQWAGGAAIGFNTDGGLYQNHHLSGQSTANNIACSNIPTTEWTTVVYQLSGDLLPFLVLSNPSKISNDGEAASPRISITGGFPLGSTTQANVFVNSNGYMIFGFFGISICCPVAFPSTSSGLDNIVAPYWSDIDISSTGQIAYQVYSSQSETMSLVSTFVSQRYGIDFTGTWMLAASWENVPQFIRSEQLTNTFQGILITDGDYSFTVFTYKCGSLSYDGDATIGFNTGDVYSYHSLSGSTAKQIACLNYPGSAWTNVIYGLFEPVEITVILVSAPSGPNYPAATWIDFECSALEGSGSGVFSYQWNVYCSSTMQRVFQSPVGNETTFRVKSTPIQCFDVVECVVFDSVLPATNSSSITISSIVGVGLFANDNPAANNTAVLADSSNQIGTLYCTSGSRHPNIGMWYSPTGAPLTNSSSGALTVEYSEGDFPSYVGLHLRSGELAISDEGVYTCVIPDENGQMQTLYAGLYRNGYSVTPVISTSGIFDTNFTVTCTSSGAPSLTTFYRDTGSIQDEVTANPYNDTSHYVIHTLVNGTSSTYDSILVFESFPSSPTELGEHSCESQTTYISSNSSDASIYSTTAIAYFGLYNIGSSVSILCTDSNADILVWLDDVNNVLDSNSSTVLLNIASVRDTEHDRVYTCRRTTGNVVNDLKLTVIVLIPPGPILDLTITKSPPTGVTAAGDFLTLNCFAVSSVAGLSGATELLWTFPNDTSVSNESSNIAVELTHVFTSQAGIHTCTGVQHSLALPEGRLSVTPYILDINIPNPTVLLTAPPGPFYFTESVTFTCEAILSIYVDEFSYVQFDWQGPQGNLSVYSDALIGSVTESSPNVYTNTLTVTSLMESDGGNYLCTVIIGASSPYVTGSSSSATALLLVSEPIPVVSLESSVSSVLDISPYNILSLNCTASLPIDITVSFQWRRSFAGVESVLIDNGDDVNVTDNLSRSLVKESILETVETVGGNVTYNCVVIVSATGVQSSDAISVLVKGPSPPAPPTTQVASTTYQSATLHWTVSYIAYDAEVYQVQYGINESQLDQVTSQVPGSNDLTATDITFSVQLTGLMHDTYYYYRVMANNSVGSSRSNTSSFLTVPLPLTVTITPSGISLAGGIYTLTCRVAEAEDISGTPQVTWFGPNGVITPGYHDSITLIGPTVSDSIVTLSLEFDPVLFELEGTYTCQAVIGSNPPQSRSNAFTIAVGTLELNVSITSSPPGPTYQAASPVNLTCEVLGFFREPLASVQWNSTCSGSCFVLGQSGSELQRTVVRSADSGIHTCTVVDALGNRGEGSATMSVTSIGLSYDGVFLSDNSEIRPSSTFPGQLSPLICASGSESSGVGQLIAPDGGIVTNSTLGLFSVSVGGVDNPGFISMVQKPGVAIDFNNGTAGVYTCALPDENDIQREIRVGIYPFDYNNNPIIVTSLQSIKDDTSVFTLSCTTNGSVPTIVTWRRNDVILSESANYQMTQILINGVHASYDNTLQIILPLDEIPGDYSCTAENLYGSRSSDSAVLSVEGLQVSDQAPLLTVGESVVLSCTTDLDASSVQWIHNDEVVVNTSGQVAYLSFNPVSDYLHGRVYTCRSVGRFGVQEQAIQLTVLFPPDLLSLMLSLEEGATAFAGDPLAVNCTVIIPNGVSSAVDLQWIDLSGVITTGGALTVGDLVSNGNETILPLRFDPLRAVHENRFFCQAVVMSPAPPHNITQSAELAIIVQVVGNLGVAVSSTPRPLPDLSFQAGTPLSLFCTVTNGGMAPFSYQWISSCDGDCFVSQQTSQTVSQPVLHSIDSGQYACVATDYIGREGSDSINVIVTGVSLILLESNTTERSLSNNSILLVPPDGWLGEVQCVSGSVVPDTGAWLAPYGKTIINSDGSPFDVTIGGQSDPGFLNIEQRIGTSFESHDEGVYTCVIPDENGITQFLHLGIYLSNFSGTPIIDSIGFAEDFTSLLSLSCLSSETPAVSVLWYKDFIAINFEADIYREHQTLINGTTATYENFLSASAAPSLLVGEYICSVSDSLGGVSENSTIEVLGVVVSGFSAESEDLIVGEDIVLSCSSDLNGVTAEWLYRGEVVSNGSGFANLEFFPVSDALHGTQYTCRVNTPYGLLEEEISLRVDVPVSSVNVSITTNDMPIAGYPFSLTCSTTVLEGLSGPVNLSWIGPDDETIVSQGDFTVQFNGEGEVSNSTITIDPLRAYDEGQYSCVATVMSPALLDPINASAEVFVDVEILFPLEVSIVDTVDPSRGPDYTAGTSASLNCTVRQDFPPVTYEWMSTCSGSCFVLRQRTRRFIKKDILYAADGGNHTCAAVDDIGNTGSATVGIRITGASLYLFDQENPRVIPNNGVVFTDSSGDLPPLQCISGSLLPNAGEWITPSGQDGQQFNLTYSNISDPGYFTVTGRSLTFADQGVYSCRIPDYSGDNVTIHVGLYYPQSLSGRVLNITSLREYLTTDSYFALSCTSSGLPATYVQWRKDGAIISESTVFSTVQVLRDPLLATYDNLLMIYLELDEIIGTYICIVENEVDSDQTSISFEGLRITGNPIFTVSEATSLLCSTDLQVDYIVWLDGDNVVVNATGVQQLELEFDPVSDLLHSNEYTCRAATSFGIQERNVTVTVEVPSSSLGVSIYTGRDPIASEIFELTCIASVLPGVDSPVLLQWLDENGQSIQETGDITIGPHLVNDTLTTQSLVFNVLRVVYSASYQCNATLLSPALNEPLVAMAEFSLDVQTVELSVMIQQTPSNTDFTASGPLMLTCLPQLGTGNYTYLWSSNCTGNCFVGNQTSKSIQRDALQSTDSGLHTCTVMDDAGNMGIGVLLVNVIGAGFYLPAGAGQLPQNPIIFTSPEGSISEIWCLSGSRTPRVGSWISPNGTDITGSPTSPFRVTYGDDDNPGFLIIETTETPLTSADQGIYTCYIPDETEVRYQSVYAGIYLPGFDIIPTVTSLEREDTTLTCNTTGSPPTLLQWEKNGSPLPKNANGYRMSEVLIDGITSTFSNHLFIDLPLEDLVGNYSCTVENALGVSNTEKIEIKGLQISGNDRTFSVSSTSSLLCTSDLDVLMIEWIYNGSVISMSNDSTASLTFDPITDDLHNRVYVCRVTSPYGTQKGNTSIRVLVPDTVLSVLVDIEGVAEAGQIYSLICSAEKPLEVLATPTLAWIGNDGLDVQSRIGNDVSIGILTTTGTVTSLALQFNLLHTSDIGQYTCIVELPSPALPVPLLRNASKTITIQIPSPTVTVQQPSSTVYAGSILTLTCTVQLIPEVDVQFSVTTNWFRSGVPLASDIRTTISDTIQLSLLAYQTELKLDPTSQSGDSGIYSCEVLITPSELVEFVTGVNTSAEAEILVQIPNLNVELSPELVTILDISPYNSATLTCSASQHTSIVVIKSIAWTRSFNGLTESVTHNGITRNITTENIDSAISASTLSFVAEVVGTTVFSCESSLNIPGDLLVTQSAEISVTVKGSSIPVEPVALTIIDLTSTLTNVQWLVPEIAYTPENYTVWYGTVQNTLSSASRLVEGIQDITAKNQLLSITLNGLEADTTYFYQIEAQNDVGTTLSVIESFSTSPDALSVFISTNGNTTAGESLDLVCRMTLGAGLSGIPAMEWKTSDGSLVSGGDSITIEGPTVEGSFSATLALRFSPLLASHGGQYSCLARVDGPRGSRSALETQDVTVQLTTPEVELAQSKDGPFIEGTLFSLACEFELHKSNDIELEVTSVWRQSGQAIEDTGRVTVIEAARSDFGSDYYTTSIIFTPLSSLYDSGDYVCEFYISSEISSSYILPATGLNTFNRVTVQSLPPPVISVSSSSPIVGEPYSATCSASVVTGLISSAVIDVHWMTEERGPITNYDSVVTLPTSVENVTTTEIQFNPLHTSHGGDYICEALVIIAEIDLERDESYLLNLLAQIPEPQVTITAPTGNIFLSGTPLVLTCDAEINYDIDTSISISIEWERDGLRINNTYRTNISETVETANFRYRSFLVFTTLSSGDSGQYYCIVNVRAEELGTHVGNITGVRAHTFSVEDPAISIDISPGSFIGLDRPPYNTFSLMCNVSKPPEVLPELQIEWLYNGGLVDRTLSQLTITDYSDSGYEMFSVLTFIAMNESDTGFFTCRGVIEVLDSNIIREEVNSIITIRGPQLPANPVSLGVTVTNSTTAIFSWLITSILYTPEIYYISYGYNGVINTNSTSVAGNTDITSPPETFSIAISGLQPLTEYSYTVLSENVIGISASSVASFYTSSSAPTAGPSSFNVSIIMATSAILTWDLPPAVGSINGIIVSYHVVCQNVYGNVVADSSVFTPSYNLSGLIPATLYNCSVSAFNNVGEGPTSSLTFATLEDAPEDSPMNISVQTQSISSVLIAWSPPSIPNGVIVQYTLYIYLFDGSPSVTVQTDGSTQRYTIMNLEPYQLIAVQVSASTRIGEGPLSAIVEGRSAEDAISAPTVSITSNINIVTAGQELTLACRVTVDDITLPPVQIAWLSPEGLLLTTQGRITISRESDTLQLTTYTLRFVPIHTSNAGEYTCHATLYSEFGTVMQSSSGSHNVIVQLPPPAVSITSLPDPVYAGINLTLVCIIDINELAVDTGVEIISSWSISGVAISTDRLGILDFNDTRNILPHSTRVPLGLIPLGSSDGDYTCDASITPLINSEYVLFSARVSDSVQLEATVPPLSANISPALAVALDIEPYDELNLTCTVTVPDGILIPKSLQWFRDSRELNDGSDNIIIQINNLDSAVTTSTLASTGSSPGYYVYTCSASLDLPGGTEVQDMALGNVTVNGPSLPQEISVNLANVSATSAVIEWTVPFLTYTPETYLLRYGKDSLNETFLVLSTLRLGAVNEMYSVSLMELTPAVVYSVEIISTNTIGSTVPRSFTFTTNEAAPSGPPLAFATIVVNSTALMFSWLPPNDNDRNGIITHYSLLCDPSPAGHPVYVILPSVSSGDRFELISNQFTPAVLYSCIVYASTSAGDGPAASGMILTPDDVPAQITALSASVLSTNSIQISWRRPNITNGLLLLYSVAVRSVDKIVFNISLDRESLRVVLVSNLEKYIPYTVTVRAMTAAGFGEPAEITLFTEEGTPDTAPRDIEFIRINGTHMRVTWTHVTLEEARGFVTSYVISYVGQGKEETVRVSATEESIIIGDLDIIQDYLVTVSAETSVGQGVASQAVIVNAVSSSFFQMRLNGVDNCTNWIIQDRSLRLQTITNAVVDVLVNTQNCQCSVSEYYIRNQQILCSQNDVIFRAQLFSTPAATSMEMITLLQDWVSGEPLLDINGQRLTVDTSCIVEIQSLSEDVCPQPGGQELNLQLVYIIVAVVGGVLLLVLLILIVFCVVRKGSQSRAKYKLRKTGDARYPTLPVTSFEMVTRPTDEIDNDPGEVEASTTFHNLGSSTPKESDEERIEMVEAGEPIRNSQVSFGFGTSLLAGESQMELDVDEPLQMESFGLSLSQPESS